MSYLSIFEYKNNIELERMRKHQNKQLDNNINNCKKIAEIFWRCSFEKKTKDQCKNEYHMLIKCIKKIHKDLKK